MLISPSLSLFISLVTCFPATVCKCVPRTPGNCVAKETHLHQATLRQIKLLHTYHLTMKKTLDNCPSLFLESSKQESYLMENTSHVASLLYMGMVDSATGLL